MFMSHSQVDKIYNAFEITLENLDLLEVSKENI